MSPSLSFVAAAEPRGVSVVADAVQVSVPQGSTRKTLLDSISFAVPDGHLCAIMGPSGAGKTTLTDVLAGIRKPNGGRVLLNGVTVDRDQLPLYVEHVPQSDVFTPTLSVEQTLQFYASLKCPPTWTQAQRDAEVSRLISALHLTSCRRTRVGNLLLRGLSGGEKRRLSCAAALLARPSLMLFDEVTTGLDSASAFSLVRLLRQLTRSEGQTILCTIHAPSSRTLKQFDHVIILGPGGRMMYSGSPRRLSAYLEEINEPCPRFCSPADHIFDVMTRRALHIQALADAFRESTLYELHTRSIRKYSGAPRTLMQRIERHRRRQQRAMEEMATEEEEARGLGDAVAAGGTGAEQPPASVPSPSSSSTPTSTTASVAGDADDDVAAPPPMKAVTIESTAGDSALDRTAAAAAVAPSPPLTVSGGASQQSNARSSATLTSSGSEDADSRRLVKFHQRSQASVWTQFGSLLRRSMIDTLKNPQNIWIRMGQVVVTGTVCGLVSLRLDDSQTSARSRVGSAVFVVASAVFSAVMSTVQVFPEKREILFRDRQSRTYGVIPYYLSAMTAMAPLVALLALLFALLTYFIINMNGNFGVYLGFVCLVVFCGDALGMAIGAGVPTVQLGLIGGPLIVVVFFLFTGFFITLNSMPVYVSWIADISLLRYAFTGIMLNEFKGVPIVCSEAEKAANRCLVTVGDVYLEQFGVANDSYGVSAGVLVALYAAFHCIGILTLLWSDYRRRRK